MIDSNIRSPNYIGPDRRSKVSTRPPFFQIKEILFTLCYTDVEFGTFGNPRVNWLCLIQSVFRVTGGKVWITFLFPPCKKVYPSFRFALVGGKLSENLNRKICCILVRLSHVCKISKTFLVTLNFRILFFFGILTLNAVLVVDLYTKIHFENKIRQKEKFLKF